MTLKSIAKLALIIVNFLLPCYGAENAFYILRHFDKETFSTLAKHHQAINLLIPQAYYINTKGNVGGYINPDLLHFAALNHVKLLALITNASFDNQAAHEFLSNSNAQRKALAAILTACQENHLSGVQFDFEGVSVKDKHALTRFYLDAYQLLHKNGFIVSFAIVPLVTNNKQPTDFLQRKYENWAGAYDLKLLGKNSDFISVMAYDQHTNGTTPGPTANIHWVEAVIQYTLHYVPANKISLGIPTYSGYWYIRNRSHGKISVNLDDISYKQAESILKKVNATLHWDNDNKINYAFYQRDWLNEYLFVENEKSFKAKMALAKNYGLRGISVFNIGNEDPKIWSAVTYQTA